MQVNRNEATPHIGEQELASLAKAMLSDETPWTEFDENLQELVWNCRGCIRIAVFSDIAVLGDGESVVILEGDAGEEMAYGTEISWNALLQKASEFGEKYLKIIQNFAPRND